jgi:signal recognition particle subunit SRP54
MTPQERNRHEIINGKRRKRIARGSGTTVQQVNQVLKQYVQARKMMKTLGRSLWGRAAGAVKMPAASGGGA